MTQVFGQIESLKQLRAILKAKGISRFTSLSDINDLFYGNLGSWLAMLSYSQFTKEELMNGTARKLIGKYHRV